jgi:NAD+ kinase
VSAPPALEPCVVALKRPVLARGGGAARLARTGHATAHRIAPAARSHGETRRAVRAALAAAGIRVTEVHVDRLDAPARRALGAARLVVTVGGDGTLLAAAHWVDQALVLGVNSAPRDSVGHFAVAVAETFAQVLERLRRGELLPVPVARLAVALDGRPLPICALNDALVTHVHPAATSRYLLRVDGRSEEHRSSGLWIATAAGSTAGIRSAGGRPQPLRSRRLQFRARELYREPARDYALAAGFVAPGGRLAVESKMEAGRLFLDGARAAYALPFGTRAEFRLAARPLRLVADPARWRRG